MKHPKPRILRNLGRLRNLRNPLNTKRLTVAFVITLVILDVWAVRGRSSAHAVGRENERTYSLVQLSLYDGSDPNLPVLLAMDSKVYDVSSGRKQYYDPGRPYHMLAGTDASALLKIAGGDIIARKYPVVGRLK